MKFWCAVLLCVVALTDVALAQGVPRIRARLTAFDGQTLTVISGTGKDAQTMSVGLMPDTRIVKQEKRALTDIKPGDYVGATFTTAKDGTRHVQEAHLFPEELRGTGEGIFTIGASRFMIDGTVSAVAPGSLTLDYRGSDGGDGPGCTGRPPAGIPKSVAGGCHGSAVLTVAAGVPVVALLAGDKSLLVPGAILALSIVAGTQGHPVTPGLTVEGMAPQPVEASPPAPVTAPHPGH